MRENRHGLFDSWRSELCSILFKTRTRHHMLYGTIRHFISRNLKLTLGNLTIVLLMPGR